MMVVVVVITLRGVQREIQTCSKIFALLISLLIHGRVFNSCEGQRVPLQVQRHGRRLLLRRPSQTRRHQQHPRFPRHRRQRPEDSRPQHPRRLPLTHRLRPRRPQPAHTPPRATEVVFVLEGVLDVGFITTANVLISKTIKQGEIFVFPRGLVHFQKNNGNSPAAVIAAFNSQLPGTQSLAVTLFGATPPVPDNVLTKAFQIGTKEVQKIKSKFAPK
ncbi:UNVERIFIED_CONTAM: Rhicadhesin receptor [Sesamum latifolium]|uniref:Germin-like protein n=1 Tax=Sesamum latifolium TaxID=2727402 RepID=A0AAW2UYZ5_9LAMI